MSFFQRLQQNAHPQNNANPLGARNFPHPPAPQNNANPPAPTDQNNGQKTQGELTDHEHGLHIAAVEAGTGQVTRHDFGETTRFTFKKPFKKTPHVQLTLHRSPMTPREPMEVFLVAGEGPAVDREGFSVGTTAMPGHTAEFRFLAMTILESSKPSSGTAKSSTAKSKSSSSGAKPKTGTTKSKTGNKTKPKTADPKLGS
ncbi:hypothetical protein BDV25DRAFT_142073 [Aspergillus avenaceus]|uniref:Uncharacterized protein n=1 Tax=Aspergillus avenaceus TaxID=36643 RepID=A0A5N6TPC8_ASPAV|nr:hypothetical protein BDV25DRAFT_142073 [Aspergillus avenaceus]